LAGVIAGRHRRFQPLTQQIEWVRRGTKSGSGPANTMDFDDLLMKTVDLLRGNPGVAEYYQRHFQFILVDEYQDTNWLQSDFIDLLAAHTRV